MSRRRDLSANEAQLWRRVAKTTKPYQALPEAPEFEEFTAKTAPLSVKNAPEMPHLSLKRAKATKALPPLAPKPILTRPKPHTLADAAGHKKVRRGKLLIHARIDLHGMRQTEAQTALASIITRTRAEGGRCVLVVTGKGMPIDPGEDYIQPQAGVIRRRLPEWLHGPGLHEHISGFATAHARDGGSGAFYVLLKAPKVK